MPRPLRIEYENAFYHVMNRGRARNNIFFNKTHYQAFLKIIDESSERFGYIIHSYCLMPNHYHLLIQTPYSNLGRIMRHINGVYTQRFNKLQKIDGPLFRGRYKAILVDEGNYLLQLSKYIHRNPIQTKRTENRLTKELKNYEYSSYPSYLEISKTPKWLNKELILSNFKNDEDILKRYQLFVETNKENEELEKFFNKKNQEMILGSNTFKEKVLISNLKNQRSKQDQLRKEINNKITTEQIIKAVAKIFDKEVTDITTLQNGQKIENISRSIAIYLCQEYKDLTLKEIAAIFNLKSSKSTSNALSKIKKQLNIGNKAILDSISKIKNEIG